MIAHRTERTLSILQLRQLLTPEFFPLTPEFRLLRIHLRDLGNDRSQFASHPRPQPGLSMVYEDEGVIRLGDRQRLSAKIKCRQAHVLEMVFLDFLFQAVEK